MIRSQIIAAALALPSASVGICVAAELGDINGDGRVSSADAYLLARWQQTGLTDIEPAPGSIDFCPGIQCSSNHAVLVYDEALRRASTTPLPHFIERWPAPAGPEALPPAPDDRVRLELDTVVHSTGDSAVILSLRLTNTVPLDFVSVVLKADGLDLRPAHSLEVRYGPSGDMKSSTHYYLISGGLVPFHTDNLWYGTQALIVPAEGTPLSLKCVLPRGTPPGKYRVDLLPATEVVTDFGEVLKPVLASGWIEVRQTVRKGHDLPFPPLEFADVDARRMGGQTEMRVTDAEGLPGDSVVVKVQMRTTRPVNRIHFFLVYDRRALWIDQTGVNAGDVKPLYRDPESGVVEPRDNDVISSNGSAMLDAQGYVEFQYSAKRIDVREGTSFDPYSVQYPPASLKYIAPLGEWVDLLELRFKIRPEGAGLKETPLLFLESEDFRQARAVFLPYARKEGMYLWPGCAESAAWWRYDETRWSSGTVRILGGGDEPREPEPPVDPALARTQYFIGDSGERGPDDVPVPLPVQAAAGDVVRLPVDMMSAIALWKVRMVFGFDVEKLELMGFELSYLDFDGGPHTVLLAPGNSWNNLECSLGPDGRNSCQVGLLPYLAILFDYHDNVPPGILFLDVMTSYKWALGPLRGQEQWDPGTVHHMGHAVFKVRDDASPGVTEVVGTETDWRPERWFFSPIVLHARSSGYPFQDDVINATRDDVPATLVRRAVIVILAPGDEPSFLRGDSNGDGRVDLSDAVHTLNALFLGTAVLHCEDAADSNDDGVLDLTDAVHVLLHLYSGGAAPPPPFPEAGVDPTSDTLECLEP